MEFTAEQQDNWNEFYVYTSIVLAHTSPNMALKDAHGYMVLVSDYILMLEWYGNKDLAWYYTEVRQGREVSPKTQATIQKLAEEVCRTVIKAHASK